MKKKDKQGFIIIASSLVFLFVVVGLVYQIQDSSKVDKVSLCPLKGIPPEQTVIVVDKSDRWDRDDITRVTSQIKSLYQNTSARTRLTVIAVAGNGEETEGNDRPSTEIVRLFDKCNPGSEQECNQLYQTCRKIKKRYEKSFGNQLEEITAILADPSQSSHSPLFETIVQIIDDSETPSLSIHLVSDLMENGTIFRFYDFIPLAKEIAAEYPIEKAGEVTVYIHFIERNRHSKELRKAVKDVWVNYFKIAGVNLKFKRLLITK